jgi:hypothetical protein
VLRRSYGRCGDDGGGEKAEPEEDAGDVTKHIDQGLLAELLAWWMCDGRV